MMTEENMWFWGYYNVSAICVDVTPDKVLCTLNGADFKSLSEYTDQIQLYWIDGANQDRNFHEYNPVKNVPFLNKISKYNTPERSSLLWNHMQNNKDAWGLIKYFNVGGNIQKVTLKIPVTIKYQWGAFTDYLVVTINQTAGHN